MLTTQDVANRLVELCREGKMQQAIDELYAPETISVEPEGAAFKTAHGLGEIAEKSRQFEAMVESFNAMHVSDPVVADHFFACTIHMNVNMKGVPFPVDMDEVCVYQVHEGKVVKEQFFYTPQPQPA